MPDDVAIHVTPVTLSQVIIERIRAGATLEETQQYYKFLREIEADEARAAFAADFVQLKLPVIPKRGRIDLGPGRKPQKYALWDHINPLIEPELAAHNFRLRFHIKQETDVSVEIEAILEHARGHSIATTKKLPLDKSGAKNITQAYGSTQSYGQRYAAKALLNLTYEDEPDTDAAEQGELTPEQLEKLQDALQAAQANEADISRLCKALRVNTLPELRTVQFPAAIQLLADMKKYREKKID